MSVNTVSTQTLSFDEIVAKAVEKKQRENDQFLNELIDVSEHPPKCVMDYFTKKIFTDPYTLSCCKGVIECDVVFLYQRRKYRAHNDGVEILSEYPKIPCIFCKKNIHLEEELFQDVNFKKLCVKLHKIFQHTHQSIN